MTIRTLRFITILLASLAMGMHLAHVLELPPKLMLAPELYLAIQTRLYGLFGSVGPVFEVGALLGAAALAYQLRGTPAFPFTLTSAAAVLLSLAVWLVFVLPVNGPINQWAATQVTPPDWMRLRSQWQFAQAGIFVFHLVGFSALVYSVLRETPAQGPSRAGEPAAVKAGRR
jgi:hypothetical protein